MRIYLVAQAWFKQLMKIYLAGDVKSLNSDMRIFLAESGGLWEAYFSEKDFANAYILQSFFYADEFTEKYIIPNAADFLLDSGAFTFANNKGFTASDFDGYLERYADFINRNKIEKFFELDVDSITGYDKVKEFRKRLESLTGRQCIPVWHPSRTKEDFLETCEDYNFVALGGIVGKNKNRQKSKMYHELFPWFINEAHKRKARIHGLGFTHLTMLDKYHFDSVDSTAWTTGNRYGYIYEFNGKTMVKYDAPAGMKLKNARDVAMHNYIEWVKFQKYAEVYL